jgi:toluene monooxygenase system protein D
MCAEVDAVIDAIRDDNPDTEVEVTDRGSYVRVLGSDRLLVTETTLQEHLGSGFEIRSLEGMLSSFLGRITTFSDHIEWQAAGGNRAAVS